MGRIKPARPRTVLSNKWREVSACPLLLAVFMQIGKPPHCKGRIGLKTPSIEQFRMASQSRCRQRQPVALDAAYQKPAGGEVAFPMPLVVADELMVVKLRGKLLFWLERLEHILKHPHVTALLLRPLVVLLEFGSELELQHGLVLIEGGDHVGYRVVRPAHAARRSVIHSGKGLGIEPVGVGGVEGKAAAPVERGDEHAQGVARGSTDAIARFEECPLLIGAQLRGHRLHRPCGHCSSLVYLVFQS